MQIMIRWREATEYFQLFLEGPAQPRPIRSTREVWDDGTVVTYRTKSKFEKIGPKKWKLTLIYDRAKNNDIAEGATFGKSVIHIGSDSKSGRARWTDDFDKDNNGPGNWKVLEDSIIRKKKSVQRTVRQLERRQETFRKKLIGVYGKCAITEESFLSALDAAHIVPAREGGSEEVANGLLLRADLHRLYDLGEFSIDTKGRVVLPSASTLSFKYKKILQGKSISEGILKNVGKALGHKLANKVRA